MQLSIPPELAWLLCLTVIAMSIPSFWYYFSHYRQAIKKQGEQQADYDQHLLRSEEILAASEELQARSSALVDRHEALFFRVEQLLKRIEDKNSA